MRSKVGIFIVHTDNDFITNLKISLNKLITFIVLTTAPPAFEMYKIKKEAIRIPMQDACVENCWYHVCSMCHHSIHVKGQSHTQAASIVNGFSWDGPA